MTLLKINDLSVSYPDCGEPAVSHLNFSVAAGEAVGIVGESGAGKSQTALAIMGLLPANASIHGSVMLAGSEVVGASATTLRKLRSRTVSMVFQDPATALNPYLRIGDQLRRILLENRHASRGEAKGRCIGLLDQVGLPDPEKQYRAYPHQLSGGMRQRVLIAAALIGEPDLIVADEPTTALDVTVQAQILALIRELRTELGTALLMITHDLGVIARSCDRLLVMDKGQVIDEGFCKEVFANPAHPHTVRLVDAVARIDKAPPAHTPGPDTVLELRGLTVSFSDRRRGSSGNFVAVQPMDLTLKCGETLAIVGESGSGKTSLARAIAGLLSGSKGSLAFLEKRQSLRVADRTPAVRRRLQMVFQDPVSSLNPAMRIARIIEEPLTIHAPKLNARARRQAVIAMLERVGLEPSLRDRYPHELSGGQAQRVAIARALVLEPRVLICDEALAALDGTVRKEILALLQAERDRSNLAIILITHDLGVVREISDRVIVMYKGAVCETASNEALFTTPQHDYTKALLAAVPTLD